MTTRGTVNARLEAVLRLSVRGPVGNQVEIDCIVDTGFTSHLTLPDTVVESLRLVRRSGGTAVLADGTSRRFDLYAAEVEWGGSWQRVIVSALGSEALIGMRFLAGQELKIEVVPGGAVVVGGLEWEVEE